MNGTMRMNEWHPIMELLSAPAECHVLDNSLELNLDENKTNLSFTTTKTQIAIGPHWISKFAGFWLWHRTWRFYYYKDVTISKLFLLSGARALGWAELWLVSVPWLSPLATYVSLSSTLSITWGFCDVISFKITIKWCWNPTVGLDVGQNTEVQSVCLCHGNT